MKNSVLRRVFIYSMIILLLYFTIFLYKIYVDINDENKSTSPIGVDYSIFYAAGKMAIEGKANLIYDVDTHHAEIESVIGRETPHLLGWFYPPNFLLMIIPLSILPYYMSLILWILITFILVLYSIYLLCKRNIYLTGIACSFPGILMNLRWGQNGFLSSSLLGFGLYFINTNPMFIVR